MAVLETRSAMGPGRKRQQGRGFRRDGVVMNPGRPVGQCTVPRVFFCLNARDGGMEPHMAVDGVQRKTEIYRVTTAGMIVNLLLTIGKFIAGILGTSSAMIADAVHSVSDLATDVVVLVFVGISTKPRDESHGYGHGKFETLAAVVIGTALAAVGIGILVNGVRAIVEAANGAVIPRPGLGALVAAVVSLILKEALFRITRRVGTRMKSSAVVANAWHHRSDALSSVGTFLGIGGAYLLGERWHVLDPIAAVVVSVLIGKAALDMLRPALGELLEASLPEEMQRRILERVASVPGAQEPHGLRTRRVGSEIAIEIHIRTERTMTVDESHTITQRIEANLRSEFGSETMVTVHVEPLRVSPTRDVKLP